MRGFFFSLGVVTDYGASCTSPEAPGFPSTLDTGSIPLQGRVFSVSTGEFDVILLSKVQSNPDQLISRLRSGNLENSITCWIMHYAGLYIVHGKASTTLILDRKSQAHKFISPHSESCPYSDIQHAYARPVHLHTHIHLHTSKRDTHCPPIPRNTHRAGQNRLT